MHNRTLFGVQYLAALRGDYPSRALESDQGNNKLARPLCQGNSNSPVIDKALAMGMTGEERRREIAEKVCPYTAGKRNSNLRSILCSRSSSSTNGDTAEAAPALCFEKNCVDMAQGRRSCQAQLVARQRLRSCGLLRVHNHSRLALGCAPKVEGLIADKAKIGSLVRWQRSRKLLSCVASYYRGVVSCATCAYSTVIGSPQASSRPLTIKESRFLFNV